MMRILKSVWCFLLLLVLTGCYNFVGLSEGRIWPKRPAFSITPSTNVSAYVNCGIDFNAVYVNGHTSFFFLRFWPNGRVLKRGWALLRRPTLADVESFQGSSIGYYRVEGEKLFIETFVPPLNAPPFWGDYQITESRLLPDAILRIRNSLRCGGEFDLTKHGTEFNIYRKQVVPGMKRQPDW